MTENKRKSQSEFRNSMGRLSTLTGKTLKRFYRNPKSMGFIILIPIMYYILLGLIFGGIGGGGLTEYNIGWVDDDYSTATNPQYSLDTLYSVFDGIDNLNMSTFNTKTAAIEAALDDKIDAFIYFPDGFEGSLDNLSKVNIAFNNSDSTGSSVVNITGMYENLIIGTQYSMIIENITGTQYGNLLNLQTSKYDAVLTFNEGFGAGLDNEWDVNMSYYYRNGLTSDRLYYITGWIEANLQSYINSTSANSTVSYSLREAVVGTSVREPKSYEIYFLQSISPTTKTIVEGLIAGIINGVVNQNPNEINLLYSVESSIGEAVNQITYSAPGYILYGPMTILSFALVILTGEKKEGIYKRLSSSEVKNHEVILSNILANMVLVFMQVGIGALILFLFGWSPVIYSLADAIIGAILNITIFSFFILALAFALAPVFKDPDTAGGGVWIILIPLMMLSGIFVPIELFGEGMAAFANVLPTRYAVIVFQNLLLKGLPLTDPSTLLAMGILLIYSTVIFIIGILGFNKFKR